MLALHDNVKTEVLVTVHAISEEFASWLLGNFDIILCNMIVFTLHNYVEAEILITVHACGKESTIWLYFFLFERLLSNVIMVTFHHNVHTKVFVAVIASGKEGLGTLELGSNLFLYLFIFLSTLIKLIVLVFEIRILLFHSLELFLIN